MGFEVRGLKVMGFECGPQRFGTSRSRGAWRLRFVVKG